MSTQHRNLFLASAIALAVTSINPALAQNKTSQEVIDARQESQILTTYALSPYLRHQDLRVTVVSGKATLTGKVEESVNKDLAKQIALGVKGVKDVDNQIVVQTDYVPPAPSADRNFGDLIDDASITTAIKSKMLWSRHHEGLATEVDTVGGKVTLRGTAETEEARKSAGRLAMNTRGVISVNNLLNVTGKKPSVSDSAKSSVKEAKKDISDGWITTKVKSTLLYSTNVDSSNVSVSTNKGIVTLSGKVDSGAEQALAIELANNVRGVKSVQAKGLRH